MENVMFDENELIALQEIMGFVKPSNQKEAIMKNALSRKIESIVGTPESRAAILAAQKKANAGEKLNKCLTGLSKYFEEKNIVLDSESPVYLTDVESGYSIQIV